MSDATAAQVYQAVQDNPDGGKKLIGAVELQAGGQLRLVSADAAGQPLLDRIIAMMNGKKKVLVRIPPPPGTPPQKYGQHAQIYERTSPDFFKGLREYVYDHFKVRLSATLDPETLEELEEQPA